MCVSVNLTFNYQNDLYVSYPINQQVNCCPQVRWAESVKVLNAKLEGLVGNTLVGAASVAYLGPLTAVYRQELIQKWAAMCCNSNVPISHNFDLTTSMAELNQVC